MGDQRRPVKRYDRNRGPTRGEQQRLHRRADYFKEHFSWTRPNVVIRHQKVRILDPTTEVKVEQDVGTVTRENGLVLYEFHSLLEEMIIPVTDCIHFQKENAL